MSTAFSRPRARLIWERTVCLATNSATLSIATSLNAGTVKTAMLVERPKGYHRASCSMFHCICLPKAHVQLERWQLAGDASWLPKRRTRWRFKCPIQPALQRMKRFRQRHLKWQQWQQLQQQQQHHQQNHHNRQTQWKLQQQLRHRQQQHVQWMEHGASLNTLDISDETILAALEEKNEVVQTRRASLPGACKKTSANNLSQEESVKPSSRQRNTVAAKEKTSAENCDLRWRAERKTFTSTSWKDTEPGTRKETWKQRTINLLLPGSLFRTMLAPMPTITIHFVLFVFVRLSLILTWWRPCTLGHFNLTCVHRRPPSPPFNCFVPLALYFAPFTTLFINLTSNVPFLFCYHLLCVSYSASVCM